MVVKTHSILLAFKAYFTNSLFSIESIRTGNESIKQRRPLFLGSTFKGYCDMCIPPQSFSEDNHLWYVVVRGTYHIQNKGAIHRHHLHD